MSGSILDALTPLRTALSESSAFQSFAGAGDATAALDKIHLYAEAEDVLGTLPLPLCVLDFVDHGFNQIAAGPTMLARGTIAVTLVATAAPGGESESYEAFAGPVGDILDDLVATGSLDATYPQLNIEFNQMPVRTPRRERHGNDFWLAQFIVEYGEQ